MKREKKRIGIMGGTFDPIHIGHLVTAEAVREGFPLDEVIFIPAAQPPHKQGRQIVPAKKRLRMTELAVAGNPYFHVSAMELARKGPSYSSDTITELRKDFGEMAEFYFITGADAVNELHTWHEVEALLAQCHFIAATRQGTQLELEMLSGYLSPVAMTHIHQLDTPLFGVSSTEIRQKLARGESIRYLVPEAVADYIDEEGLYR